MSSLDDETADSVVGIRTRPVDLLVEALGEVHPGIRVAHGSPDTAPYRYDAGTTPRPGRGSGDGEGSTGPAVAYPATADEVQVIVRTAARFGVTVVPRGAGSGLAGGAAAHAEQLVLSTEGLNRIVEVSPLDEVAVVEPGVINAALNAHLEQFGLFYAPDPASYEIATIGGNIATNAGGLRCAKYGVTRDSVLALDVVLADGSLISVGHRSIKGVAGLDLVSLFVGSEGTLGIVVRATVRLRPIPVARRTVTAYFDSTAAGAQALGAITLSPVRPSVIEFFDEPTLQNIDEFSGSRLLDGGRALILVELDGYGIDEQTADLTRALTAVGGRVKVESDEDGERLWELRRSGRGSTTPKWAVGEDIAVPKSQLPEIYGRFAEIEERFDVLVSSLSHAGDGNLHPGVFRDIRPGEDLSRIPADVEEAGLELVRIALSLGGTVTGEHGVGTLKRELAELELSERVRSAQLAIKAALDPSGLLNPGKAI